MRLLLDTHILIWAAEDRNLSAAVRALIEDEDNDLAFSAVSLWEIAIKAALSREDFRVDVARLARALIDHGYRELPMTGAHAAALTHLPPIHKDPFDRMLVAQATVERLTLVTADPVVAKYAGPVRLA
jgi:PIN domain nuclease of toxin-antitoxin system